jgi:hypothetical protein
VAHRSAGLLPPRWQGRRSAASSHASAAIHALRDRAKVLGGSFLVKVALGIQASNVRFFLYEPEGKCDEPRTGFGYGTICWRCLRGPTLWLRGTSSLSGPACRRSSATHARQSRTRRARPADLFQQVLEDKIAKNRVHLDVRAAPGLQGDERMAALEADCERLVALGATRVRRFEPEPPMSLGWIVLTDPEGNEFCLD